MKARKIVVLLGAVTLCAAGFGGCRHRALLRANSSLLAVNERTAATQREIERLRERLAEIAEERASLEKLLRKDLLPSIQSPSLAMASEKNSTNTPEALVGMVQALRDREAPEGQRRELAWHRAQLNESYEGFVQKLRLGPAEAQRFEAALMRRAEDQTDIVAVMRAHGLTLMDPTLGEMWNKAEQDYQASQKVLLGEDGYRKLQEFERTVSVRDFVRGFIGVTTLAGQPLSSQQAEQLVGIFAATTESYPKGEKVSVLSVDWDAGLKRAEEIISPDQLKLIATYEPQGGTGGIAWIRFNKKLNDAQRDDADRRPQRVDAGQSPPPKR